MTQDIRARTRSGIVVGFKPTTGKRYRIELWRSTQTASTASSLWTRTIVDPTSQGYSFIDELPLSTRTYYYKARQLGLGSSNSSYSLTVSAKPQKFPEIWQSVGLNINNLGNVEVLGGDLWLSSSKTAKVGQQQSTGTVGKVHRIRFEDGMPDSSTQLVTTVNGYVTPGSSRTIGLQAAVLLTPGARVTKFRIRNFRGSTADQVLAGFVRVNSTAGITNLSTANNTGATGWVTTTGGAVSETISTQYNYYTRIVLNKSLTTGDVRFMYWEFEYQMPDYKKAL